MNEVASCSTIKEGVPESDFDPTMPFDFSTSDFSAIVETPGFVDKTLLLKELLCSDKMILITAPRRFGKSTNMDMIKKFVEIQVDEGGVVIDKEASSNYKIFKDNNLLVFQDGVFFNQHFATYPVIHACFKRVGGSNFNLVLYQFKFVLQETFQQHKYLLNSDKLGSGDKQLFQMYCGEISNANLNVTRIQRGLKFLSKCLYNHFGNKKVFVLIDEYDAPINNTMFSRNIYINELNEFLCMLFSNALKENQYVERALITGISYFATAGLPGVNNIKKYMFLGNHRFVKYYGLIESEVDALLSKFKIDDKKRDDVKSYYNGYSSRGGVKLFSLWSVLHYLQKKELLPYWQKSGNVCGLYEALRFPLIQITIERLLKNESKNIEIFDNIELRDLVELRYITLGRADKTISSPDLFLNFLLQQGYLTYKGTENSITIPNKEVRDEFTEELNSYYGPCTDRLFSECSAAFNEISVSDIESFQKFVETFQCIVHTVSDDIIKQNERIFHSLLFCVMCRGQFELCDDVEFFRSRHGPDLIVLKGKIGFMIEIKFKRNSKKVLQQTIEKEYYTKFDNEKFKDLEHKLYLAVTVSEDLHVSLAALVNTLDINKAEYFPR